MAMYRVAYEMDVEASSAREAAFLVARTLSAPYAPLRGVYEVIECESGLDYQIDLDARENGGRREF